jgi:outer membrane murein-binding lipoprotein Lpp
MPKPWIHQGHKPATLEDVCDLLASILAVLHEGNSGGTTDAGNSAKLDQILTEVQKMAGELAQLQADVAAEDTVIDSAITLLGGIKAALDAAIASGDPAALTALSADIQARTQALATAVTTNTPATP